MIPERYEQESTFPLRPGEEGYIAPGQTPEEILDKAYPLLLFYSMTGELDQASKKSLQDLWQILNPPVVHKLNTKEADEYFQALYMFGLDAETDEILSDKAERESQIRASVLFAKHTIAVLARDGAQADVDEDEIKVTLWVVEQYRAQSEAGWNLFLEE